MDILFGRHIQTKEAASEQNVLWSVGHSKCMVHCVAERPFE